ncbi:MAG TPA: response regulator [Nitrospirae bacterium]|nr:response regulator [Nitrospirota bacterium]
MDVKTRLMVVDDEPIVGKRLKSLLEKVGYDVKTFTDGSAAIEELVNNRFDIIITDLKMKNVDGMDILKTALKSNHNSKVIMITGFSRKETATEAFNKGAFEFIIKPFKIDKLKQVIRKAEDELKKTGL